MWGNYDQQSQQNAFNNFKGKNNIFNVFISTDHFSFIYTSTSHILSIPSDQKYNGNPSKSFKFFL